MTNVLLTWVEFLLQVPCTHPKALLLQLHPQESTSGGRSSGWPGLGPAKLAEEGRALHGEGSRQRATGGGCKGRGPSPFLQLLLPYLQTYVSSASAGSQRIFQISYGLQAGKYKT